MKYKIGDEVRLKTKNWWDLKVKESRFTLSGFIGPTLSDAEVICGKVGKIIDIEQTFYKIVFDGIYKNISFKLSEDWIEREIHVNIFLKQIKNEI